ncbi:hypothetical protein RHMOL_RhmolMtG0007700 (mitochondrion) [Rhododendron molle]|nr:hypothetical protein RHMOL_RhmolMtG0004100 [Rhododendron molle]KAI8522421.1 hypothetical protein RHMOL_RhmolMtG0007700 [Rhododendron molle]
MQAPTGMPTQRERIEALEAQVAGVDGFNATLALLEERVVILEEAREQTQGQGWEHAIAEMRLQLEELTGRVNLPVLAPSRFALMISSLRARDIMPCPLTPDIDLDPDPYSVDEVEDSSADGVEFP